MWRSVKKLESQQVRFLARRFSVHIMLIVGMERGAALFRLRLVGKNRMQKGNGQDVICTLNHINILHKISKLHDIT